MAVEVHSDEVARRHIIVVAHPHVNLEGARASVMPVILGHIPPIHSEIPEHPQRKHGDHAHSHKQRPMGMRAALCLSWWESGCCVVLCRYSAPAWWDVRWQIVHIGHPLMRALRGDRLLCRQIIASGAAHELRNEVVAELNLI